MGKLFNISLEQRQIFVKIIKIKFQGPSINWSHPRQTLYSYHFIFRILYTSKECYTLVVYVSGPTKLGSASDKNHHAT